MSFLGGVFAGSNPKLENDINQSGQVAGFGTAVGEGDIGNASAFYNTLLAGNPAETAKLLAPQISEITGQGQQRKQTMAEFGTRSGGNNAAAQTLDDKTRGNIDDMISKLTGQAAGGAASLGTSTLGLGLEANSLQAQESQMQLQNQKDSIFGKGLADLAQTGLNAAEGGLGF
jgi:hypothetical protein